MAEINMQFKTNFHNINLIRIAIKGVLEKVFESQQDADDLLLAITEAMNNIAHHSDASKIEATVHVADEKMIFQMTTEGQKFDSTQKSEMPDIQEQSESGFGLALIQELVDFMDYEFKDNKNILRLGKYISSEKKEE